VQMFFTILGVALTVASLVYAAKTDREKAHLERLIKAELAGIAGNINAIRPSATWADTHLITINRHAIKLAPGEDVSTIIDSAQLGARDATAAARMLDNLLNQVLSLQKGLFGDAAVAHCGGIEAALAAYSQAKGAKVEKKPNDDANDGKRDT